MVARDSAARPARLVRGVAVRLERSGRHAPGTQLPVGVLAALGCARSLLSAGPREEGGRSRWRGRTPAGFAIGLVAQPEGTRQTRPESSTCGPGAAASDAPLHERRRCRGWTAARPHPDGGSGVQPFRRGRSGIASPVAQGDPARSRDLLERRKLRWLQRWPTVRAIGLPAHLHRGRCCCPRGGGWGGQSIGPGTQKEPSLQSSERRSSPEAGRAA